jgi:protein-S-isoprenylcysteine O-methyltransferase Ste14
MPDTAKPAATARPPTGRAPRPARSATACYATAAYATVVYAFFLAVLAYAIGFFANAVVPRSIDHGPGSSWPLAAGTDLLLLALFAAQHTVMARPWFKRAWARLVPEPAERATFVLAASLVLALLYWQWRPIRGTVWHLTGSGAAAVLAVYAAGWLLALTATFAISHADLFGLRQAFAPARGVPYTAPPFTERGLYRRVRHPLMAGFVIAFWAAPVMTAGHLLFAAAATGYILAGIAFEERDLRRYLGEAYTAYAARVPALVPGLRRRGRAPHVNTQPEETG